MIKYVFNTYVKIRFINFMNIINFYGGVYKLYFFFLINRIKLSYGT